MDFGIGSVQWPLVIYKIAEYSQNILVLILVDFSTKIRTKIETKMGRINILVTILVDFPTKIRTKIATKMGRIDPCHDPCRFPDKDWDKDGVTDMLSAP